VSITGFTSRDFDIFDLPDFETRMPTLKAEITPKLKAIGEVLAPRLSEAMGHDIFPHVAQHLRRTVNAPEETWVAFARNKRAYKPFVHTRVAINGTGLKIVCHLEDYARDKPAFAENLKRNAKALAAYLAEHAEILSYDLSDPYGKPMAGRQLNMKALKAFSERLLTVKSQHVSFAIPIDRSSPVVANPDMLVEAALKDMALLLPIYRLGAEEKVKL
jgi:uncharacterized protein YktB (UPF0637 family)